MTAFSKYHEPLLILLGVMIFKSSILPRQFSTGVWIRRIGRRESFSNYTRKYRLMIKRFISNLIILSGFWYNANASCLNLTLDTSAKKSFHKIDTNKLKLYCKLLCLVDGGVLFSNRFATNNQID